MGVKGVFLLGSPLILSLLKTRDVEVVWNKKKKMSSPNGRSPLNSSIENFNFFQN